VSGFQLSPSGYSFASTFAGIAVEIQYEVEVSEDHRGRDVEIIPTVCVIGENGVDLCEDAGFFRPDQLKKWLAQAQAQAQAQADYANLGGSDDFDGPESCSPADTDYFASCAEDQFIAERDRAHYGRAGL
jgi:hypothetical protein